MLWSEISREPDNKKSLAYVKLINSLISDRKVVLVVITANVFSTCLRTEKHKLFLKDS